MHYRRIDTHFPFGVERDDIVSRHVFNDADLYIFRSARIEYIMQRIVSCAPCPLHRAEPIDIVAIATRAATAAAAAPPTLSSRD